HAAVIGDKHIRGLDVAVNHTLAVRHTERGSHFRGPRGGPRKGNATLIQNAIEGLTFQKFHYQIGRLGGFVDAHIVERDDRRMGKLADDTRFLKETLARCAARQFLGKKLYGHQPADQRIVRACHASMRTGADDFENFVASNLQEVRSLRFGNTVPLVNDGRWACSIKWSKRPAEKGTEVLPRRLCLESPNLKILMKFMTERELCSWGLVPDAQEQQGGEVMVRSGARAGAAANGPGKSRIQDFFAGCQNPLNPHKYISSRPCSA